MKIKVVKQIDKKIRAFQDKEWEIADTEHYGKPHSDWSTKRSAIIAYEGDNIIGTLELDTKAGVTEVATLLVSSEKRGGGVGTALLEKAEAIAKEHHSHKLYLITGKGWKAEKFYQKHGFIPTGTLPKHYLKHDFVSYTKFI